MKNEHFKTKSTVLIAGAGSRLGKALINELCNRNYTIIAASRTKPKIDTNLNFSWIKLDVTNIQECKDVVFRTTEEFKGIDILINCSGYYPTESSIFDDTIENISLDINVTYRGPVALSKFYVEANRQYGKGDIVFISSNAALQNTVTDRIVYSANKAAISRFSELLDEEISQLGMRSHVIVPWQLVEDTDPEVLRKQNGISYLTVAKVIADAVSYEGNAHIRSIEVKPRGTKEKA